MATIRIRIGNDGQTTFAVQGAHEADETVVSEENIPLLACGKLTDALERAVGQVVERQLCAEPDARPTPITVPAHETT